MTLTQILQKLRSYLYTKKEIDSMGGGTSLSSTLNSKANKSDLSAVATSGSYNDLTNKPTIPTVNNATLTIQKNGTTVKTFTANASSNVTCNITVPTKISDLTNDSGFVIDVSGKADKATTLSGYGITDAYTKSQVDTKISDLVNSAPETLDTLNELASALGNDPNFATTIANQIGTKANASDLSKYLPLRGGTLSGSINFSGTCYTTVGTGSELSKDRYVVTTTSGANPGGALYLYGGDFENSWGEKGNFRLVAQSKEKGSNYLLGTPSGSLTWNGKELATQEYVNTNLGTKANDSNVVHKSGNEDISGTKNIKDWWKSTHTTVAGQGVKPSAQSFRGFEFRANDDSQTGWYRNYVNTDGTTISQICTRNKYATDGSGLSENGSAKTSLLEVGFEADGNTYTKIGSDKFIPYGNNIATLGTSSLKWKDVYATTLHGDVDFPITEAQITAIVV